MQRASFQAYPRQNLLVVGEVGMALVAAVDLGPVQVGIVLETHLCGFGSKLKSVKKLMCKMMVEDVGSAELVAGHGG